VTDIPSATTPRSGGRALLGLLALAISVWLASAVALIAWFFSTNTRDLGLGAVAVPFAMVGIGYLLGGGAIVGAGAWQVVRRRVTAGTVGGALAIYLAPAALMVLWAVLVPRLAPLTAVESDLGGMLSALALPIALLLLAFGLLIGWRQRHRAAGDLAIRILTPLLIGVVSLGTWLGWRQLSSPEARGRDALQFSIDGGGWASGGLVLDATLELSRDAAYQYSAIYLEERSGAIGGRADQIQWAEGTPPMRRGQHRCRIVWQSLATEPSARNRVVIFQVRAPPDRTGYGQPVAEFRIPLDAIVGADSIPSP
jgi:hypothetical protein